MRCVLREGGHPASRCDGDGGRRLGRFTIAATSNLHELPACGACLVVEDAWAGGRDAKSMGHEVAGCSAGIRKKVDLLQPSSPCFLAIGCPIQGLGLGDYRSLRHGLLEPHRFKGTGGM